MRLVKFCAVFALLAVVCASPLTAQPSPDPAGAPTVLTQPAPAPTAVPVVVQVPAPTVSTPSWLNAVATLGIGVTMALFGWGVAVFNKKAGLEGSAAASQIEAHARDALQSALTNLAGRAVTQFGPKLDAAVMSINNPVIRTLAQAAPGLAGDAIRMFGLTEADLSQKIIDKIGVLTAPNPSVSPSVSGAATSTTGTRT